jgi:hypothetical protein
MWLKRIPVSPVTVTLLLREMLPSRQKGHAPDPTHGRLDDLQMVISILTDSVKFGTQVHLNSWHEIIRRLGMLGRLDDVEKLCLWLAAWYKPDSTLGPQSLGYSSPLLPTQHRHSLPSRDRVSHPLHPLRIIFPDSLQRAIVEWGFKHQPLLEPLQLTTLDISDDVQSVSQLETHQYTRGVTLLRQLKREGVYINLFAMEAAINFRLKILFGHGESDDLRNRRLKEQNILTREEMVKQLNKAWGSDIFYRNTRNLALKHYVRKLRNGSKTVPPWYS